MIRQRDTKLMKTPEHIVYVVDDDERLRDSIDDLLRACGMEVAGFGSAADYLKHEKPAIPACLILDIELPDINGLELQRRLLGAPHPPIVFITGHGDIPGTVQAMKAGAIDFLTKPFTPAQLLTAVEAALALDRQRLAAEGELKALRDHYNELSPREREVLPLVVRGLLNKQGAAELGIAEVTYQIHRGSIMKKMATRSLADLVRMAIKLGIPTEKSARTQSRIGVIDDDRNVRESLGDLLESAGYSVRLFSSAAAFCETDAVQTVACLICDICMPGMDGWALEHRMAKEQPELSIILITGDEAAWAKGASGLSQAQKRVLLKKPFDKQQLLTAVARAVA